MRVRAHVLVFLFCACESGGLPEGWRRTPMGDGPRVVWDLEAEPLPEIPLPNDIATWPDPGSPTKRRLNASLVAPSGMERRLRQNFDRLDGWGTFAPISVRFDQEIDTDELMRRQGRGQFTSEDFAQHAVYLIDLATGVPVPLDVNSELFPRVVANPNSYYENDPRAGGSNLLFETVAEDLDGDGEIDPGEDTDSDGVLDVPNTIDGQLHGTTHETIDRMLWFYERETDTLILRPILPLREQRTYAVVLTQRLTGRNGSPVRSPFDFVHHFAQHEDLASLPALFAERPHIYGDLASSGWEGVAFAWTFTTQSVRGDLRALREGLYGRGRFADLATSFPARLTPAPLRGGSRADPCEVGERVYTVTPAELRVAFEGLPLEGLGIPTEQLGAVLDTLERSVSHFAFAYYESPYLLGQPDAESPNDVWDIDRVTGEARVDRDLVPMFIVIPKETEAHRQPFPVTLYAHGYGTMNLEAIAFAGLVASHGVATVSIDAQGHGLPLDNSIRPFIESILGSNCLAPLGRALALDRARDLNGDGAADSAGLFFSAYMFHTRDAIRQTVLDFMQAVRILRSFQGHPDAPDGMEWVPGSVMARDGGDPFEFTGDVDNDGTLDRAGDFDGNGVPDLGGWDRPYMQWGSSLGGIISMVMAGVEPAITAAAPVSGGGGLFDIGLRTSLGTARHPVWLRVMGPLITSVPSNGPNESTSCTEGTRSLRFELPDLNEPVLTEFACLPSANLDEGDAILLTNLRNGEVRCTRVGAEGRFRIQVPASEADPLSLVVYDNGAAQIDFSTCIFAGEPPPVADSIDTWRSANGPAGPGRCPTCAIYRGVIFEMGSTLVAPTEGLGLPRQTPDLRRLSGLAQIALEPADPVNYARHVFLDPARAEDVTHRTRSVLVMNVAGDTTVPPSTSNVYARAAGILPFLPPEAPDELADWRAPDRFRNTYTFETPDDVLIAYHVHEGLSRLERHPVRGASHFVADVDDMSDGRQFFAPDGESQLALADGGIQPARLNPPLRWGRESHPAIESASLDPWSPSGGFPGYSSLIHAYAFPVGQHVILPVDPRKRFDEGEYLINAIGWYLASGGRELAWYVLPDPSCLESSSCAYGE